MASVKHKPSIEEQLQKAREKMSDKIEYTLDYDVGRRNEALTRLTSDLETGRYRVTFERVRAELPPEHYWDGTDIVRRTGTYCQARYYVLAKCGGVLGKTPSGLAAAVHPGVIDAFRAEGLLPKAGS